MEKDFITTAGELLPKMRLIAEGAVSRYENGVLENDPIALNDVAAALYELRQTIAELQKTYAKGA